jgi:Pyrimidine dimer DNA glycosylase
MRIWDLSPRRLCRRHLLGEHRELHAIWSILRNRKLGYRNHPETRRWRRALGALQWRHVRLEREMRIRGYRHQSPLIPGIKAGPSAPPYRLESVRRQVERLKAKGCDCRV